MNTRVSLFILVISFTILVGCQQATTPPPSNVQDRTITDYEFSDISNSCTLYNNVNTSTNDSTYCQDSQKRETFIYHTQQNNWSVLCCEFDNKCLEETETNVDNLCEYNNNGNYTGYVYNDDGFWIAQCCNSQGGSCYVDLQVNISDDTTVCDEQYHQNTYSVKNNNTHWNSMCCIGGLEE